MILGSINSHYLGAELPSLEEVNSYALNYDDHMHKTALQNDDSSAVGDSIGDDVAQVRFGADDGNETKLSCRMLQCCWLLDHSAKLLLISHVRYSFWQAPIISACAIVPPCTLSYRSVKYWS